MEILSLASPGATHLILSVSHPKASGLPTGSITYIMVTEESFSNSPSSFLILAL